MPSPRNVVSAKRSRYHGFVWSLFVLECASSLACVACSDGAPEEEPAVDPAVRLAGGDTTNRLLLGSNAFTRPADNITDEHELSFYTGNSFFNQSWVTAPASAEAHDGLGPLFNARSCSACHFKDGRGRPPLEEGEPFSGLLLRLSVEDGEGIPISDDAYGGQLQPFSIEGVPAEGQPSVTYREVPGEYDDTERYTLLEPVYTIGELGYGDLPERLLVSPRVAPAVFGLGLLESIPEKRLEELADPDDEDGDGVSGRIHRVPDVRTGELAIGRMGWKAEQPSVLQQSAGAFVGDMGITTSLFPDQDCGSLETECLDAPAGGEPEISDELLDAVVLYARLLAVPVRSSWDSPDIRRGERLFLESGCDACHTPAHETAKDVDLIELRQQRIFPYTDLLLHDLGPGLSDERPSLQASGSEWRTAPLWGIGRYADVNGHERLLHDGRARGVAEAILWHDGEAAPSRDAFKALGSAERDALVRFVESL
jgi:CxxC motif-containing protein (DUF1111 family)